jgi:2,4-dienoyl-CoA reductase-like NADH-dependent reductase (Old Yellow Enzyme family)
MILRSLSGAVAVHTSLFDPFTVRGITLANRLVVPPMCQYSAVEGSATDWHLMHLGNLALSGAGLLIIEATAVAEPGRITHGCLGLYSDANEAALKRVVDFARRHGNSRIGIQLSHAGRKASTHLPWESKASLKSGGRPLAPGEAAWPTISASPTPHDEGWPVPIWMDEEDLDDVEGSFVAAARRAVRLGVEVVEIHAAHGYLLHQFLSPISNKRGDLYGGTLEKRIAYPLEIISSVRRVLPEAIPLLVRISATDWVEGGWTLEDSIVFCNLLREVGVDVVDVSSGGVSPHQRIAVGKAYQVPFAKAIRAACSLPVIAVGDLGDAGTANAVLADGAADLVAVGRAHLSDPRWMWRAQQRVGVGHYYPPQYAHSRLRPADPVLTTKFGLGG